MPGTAKYKKTSPEGIDIQIQALQDYFVSSLWISATWNVYGRVYLNLKDGQIIPEVLKSGNDYLEVLTDDTTGHCFFMAGDTIDNLGSGEFSRQLSIVFMLKITDFTAVTHRGDEEIIMDLDDVLRDEPYGFVLSSFEIGQNALGSITADVTNDNMQPYFIVAANGTIYYTNENC